MHSTLYSQPATRLTPALVIYLVDTSDSMSYACGTTTKIECVNAALRDSIKHMVRRSMQDGVPQPRYQVAILSYGTRVVDVLNGICSLTELVQTNIPSLYAEGDTDTVAGFAVVEQLLQKYLAALQRDPAPRCPAPLVCHLTDGMFTTEDPTPVVKRIQTMRVSDGPVLVENVYMADDMLRTQVQDWHRWEGILKENDLVDVYAKQLFQLSSPLPETYRQTINTYGYHLRKGASLFFPGTHRELVKLALVISAGTQLKDHP